MPSATDGTEIIATTPSGKIRGKWINGAARFAGIKYALPPTGERRFRPPEPVPAWPDTLDATEFGPICPQNPSMMDALFEGQTEQWDEDCLSLNVWVAPDDEAALTDEHRPVMVWIHGGGFEMGSGSSPLYDGSQFAKAGVVLVGINYRLGSLGFLELGHLDESYAGSGNVGLLDQVLALEWVRDHIAAFGGDPSNVTIFGQSAGSMSSALLMTMPKAKGLFSKVIAQSGGLNAARTSEGARNDAEAFCSAGGFASIEDLRSAEPAKLLAAHSDIAASRIMNPEAFIAETGSPLSFLAFRPVADGIDVPTDPLDALKSGSAEGIPLICGTTSEEWKLFSLFAKGANTFEELEERAAHLVADPKAAVECYRDAMPDDDAATVDGQLVTDLVFTAPVNALADTQRQHADVFQYLWTWGSPAFGGMLGAAHAIELPFVFSLIEDHRVHTLVGPNAPVALSAAITQAWVKFATSGTPDAAATPKWTPIEGGERPVQVFDETSELAINPNESIRQFWLTDGAKPAKQS